LTPTPGFLTGCVGFLFSFKETDTFLETLILKSSSQGMNTVPSAITSKEKV